jgi:GMP synthase (glutamine-hydrolysing)
MPAAEVFDHNFLRCADFLPVMTKSQVIPTPESMTPQTDSMSRSVVALRHVHFEDLGTLGTVLGSRGATIRYVEAGRDAVDVDQMLEARLVVVLGGPISVYDEPRYPWLLRELHALEARLRHDLPTLGICLGAQLLARALGARVFAGPVQEIGWEPLDLTSAGVGSALRTLGRAQSSMFHWHGDTFDLPQNAILLASSRNYEHQAFAWGRSTLAFQCHPELDWRGIESWLIGHASELLRNRIDIVRLRDLTSRNGPTLATSATAAFDRWLNHVGWPEEKPQGHLK